MKTLRIALFGCGVVGSGVWRILHEHAQTIAAQSGVMPVIVRTCVRDLQKERKVDIPCELLTDNPAELLNDPKIDVVIEVMGGERDALGVITRSLVDGRGVITANKVVVARHLPLLSRLERLHGGRILYGAAVCGAVPILKVIDETLVTDRIMSVRGIVNGSTNFILSRLAEGHTRREALALADCEGFLEADPSDDLSGSDAAHKLSILVWHAFGVHIPPSEIPTTGIDGIDENSAASARAKGGTLRLIAEARRTTDGINLSVAPRHIPHGNPLAGISDELNIVELDCEFVGTQRFIGRGAGSLPTANAIVSDLLDFIVRRSNRRSTSHPVYSESLRQSLG